MFMKHEAVKFSTFLCRPVYFHHLLFCIFNAICISAVIQLIRLFNVWQAVYQSHNLFTVAVGSYKNDCKIKGGESVGQGAFAPTTKLYLQVAPFIVREHLEHCSGPPRRGG